MREQILLQALFLIMIMKYTMTEDDSDEDIASLPENEKQDLYDIASHKTPKDDSHPQNVTAENIHYYLFTKHNPENYKKIDPSDPHQFNRNSHVVFLIHGWTQNRTTHWYQALKDTIIKRKKHYYVVQTDYSKYSNLDYRSSTYTTKAVGGIIGEFIVKLINDRKVRIKNFLIIGHSLGGQVAGFVGKKVKDITNKKLPRIIAPDAAGPLFENQPETERLSPHDAEVVHVIHTDGNTFGMLKSCGTIDFFPNGGSHQKGCIKVVLMNLHNISSAVMCDHHRSWRYLIEGFAIKNKFVSRKCSSYDEYKNNRTFCAVETASLGDLELTATGNFYLETNEKSPYSK